LRMVPYRTVDNVIDGVVLTFVDISAQQRARELEESVIPFLQGVVDTVREPFLVLGPDLRVSSANRSFYETFKVSRENTEKRFVYELGNGQWNIPGLRQLLDDLCTKDAQFENFVVEHDFPDVGSRKILLNARRIKQEGLKTEMILLAMEDVTTK
jgi:two-component system CheB/CheR fusion protein